MMLGSAAGMSPSKDSDKPSRAAAAISFEDLSGRTFNLKTDTEKQTENCIKITVSFLFATFKKFG